MAYVIAEPCIGTKDNSCVEVCPVDCIHPTPDEPDYDKVEMLYIDPEECIDCDACVEACPVDACFAEDQLPDEWQRYAQINAEYFTTGARGPSPMPVGGAPKAALRRTIGSELPRGRRASARRRRHGLQDRQLQREHRHEPAGGLADGLRAPGRRGR